MKITIAAAVALTLAGCASVPRPQVNVLPRPIVKAAPAPAPVVVAEPDKPATFKERYQEFKKKHPIKWVH